MKCVIALLCLAPTLASATTDNNLYITSGSMMLGEGVPQFDEFTACKPACNIDQVRGVTGVQN